MSATSSQASSAAPAGGRVNYYNAEKGLWSWLTTIDHKRIGVMYLMSTLTAFFAGGMFALALRLSLISSHHHVLTVIGQQLWRHRLQATAEEQIQKKRLDDVVAMVA